MVSCHAPHHAPKEWVDKYKGRDNERQKKMGIVPKNTELAPLNEGVQKWDDLSTDEKKLFLE